MTAISVQDVLYKPSGVKVEILSEHDEGEYKMVRSTTTGKVFFAHKGQIEIVEGSEDKKDAKPALKRRGRQIIQPEIPFENRININGATPERLTQVLKGVGIKLPWKLKSYNNLCPESVLQS
jgi:DNA uptake protein ComE-like DNA-binding protein